MKKNFTYPAIGRQLAKPVYITRVGCSYQIIGKTKNGKSVKLDLEKIPWDKVMSIASKTPTQWGKLLTASETSSLLKRLPNFGERIKK